MQQAYSILNTFISCMCPVGIMRMLLTVSLIVCINLESGQLMQHGSHMHQQDSGSCVQGSHTHQQDSGSLCTGINHMHQRDNGSLCTGIM